MLANTMMPEAFEHGGKLVGVVTTFGFALAFAISALSVAESTATRAGSPVSSVRVCCDDPTGGFLGATSP